ncbi:MAG: glycosyltransferase family 4 protein [Acidimicrobiales bacterium]
MRILVVTHYFPPEIGAPQARLSELAHLWAAAGDRVTVLTGMPNHPTGVVPSEYRGKLRLEEEVDGYQVVRNWVYATPNEKVVKKSLGHLSFMVSGVILGTRRSGPADVVVVSSPTFFSIASAWLLARLKGAKLVVEVRDLWPAIIVELGVLSNRRVIRVLERLELKAYRAADQIVVVSEGFRGHLTARGVPPDKVHTIPNGVDLGLFCPDGANGGKSRARLGAPEGKVLVLYVGAHGISQGLTTLADAAARLGGEAVHFSFVGEGSRKQHLERHIRRLGLTNVTLVPGVPRNQVPGLLAAADICVVCLRDVPLFSSFIPSKIFEYLGAGKAVVGSVRGETADILRRGGAVVVEPGDAAAIADAVRELAGDPCRRAAMGEKARLYVSEHFNRHTQAERYRTMLRATVSGSTST